MVFRCRFRNKDYPEKIFSTIALAVRSSCRREDSTSTSAAGAFLSLFYNVLATTSGLFYIDPKASPKLAVQIWQMARFLDRDDGFRVLNYGTSGKVKGKSPRRLSKTDNPFTFGSAEALTQLLVSLMPVSDGASSTTVELEDRVVLRDLQEQIEGETHFVFSGQIVRGDMFFANPSLKKAQLRVPQLLQLVQGVIYENAA